MRRLIKYGLKSKRVKKFVPKTVNESYIALQLASLYCSLLPLTWGPQAIMFINIEIRRNVERRLVILSRSRIVKRAQRIGITWRAR